MRRVDPITVDRLREVLSISDDGLVSFRTKNGRNKAGEAARLRMNNGRYTILIDGKVLDMTRVAWAWHRGSWPSFWVWQVIRYPWNFSSGNLEKWTEFNAPSPKK